MKALRKFLIYIFIFSLILSLTSCSASDLVREVAETWRITLELYKSEYDDILEFFGDMPETPRTEGDIVPRPEADSEILPTIKYLPHTEIVESVYNKPEDGLAIFNSYDSDGYAPPSDELSEAEKAGYTALARPAERGLDSYTELFRSVGIEPYIEYRANTAPSGEVFAVSYAGISDSSAYYVNPVSAVTLYVSADKPAVVTDSENGDNIVYITYDDGPTSENTEALLDILDTYGVKASFFATGNAIQKYPEAAREIVLRGHLLGCHSVTHEYEKIYSSPAALEREIEEWERITAEAGIELHHRLFRYPGGSVGKYITSSERASFSEMLASRGYSVFDWNVVTNDSILYMREEGEDVYDYIKKNFIKTLNTALAENRGKERTPIIILMHETVDETVHLTSWLLDYLIDRGYTFGSLEDIASYTFGDS